MEKLLAPDSRIAFSRAVFLCRHFGTYPIVPVATVLANEPYSVFCLILSLHPLDFATPSSVKRLPSNRTPIEVTVDGKAIRAFLGETVAEAMLTSGINTFVRSLKYHRKRGPFCLEGSCEGCLVRINNEPNVQSCMVAVKDGMTIETQNGYPNVTHDVVSLTDRVFHKGMNHHTLMTRPKLLNDVTSAVVRKLAGLGEPPTMANVTEIASRQIETAALVIGYGRAGKKILPLLGKDAIAIEQKKIDDAPHNVITEASVIAYYEEENVFVAAAAHEVITVKADRVIIAMGCYQEAPVWPGSDLPGVFGIRAIATLLDRNVIPGQSIALPKHEPNLARKLKIQDVEVYEYDYLDVLRCEALGDGLRLITTDGSFDCDVVVAPPLWSAASGIGRQLGCQVSLSRDGYVIRVDDSGKTSVHNVVAVGSVTGYPSEFFAWDDVLPAIASSEAPRAYLPVRAPRTLMINSPKAFACRCEDVSTKDVLQTINDGYPDIEEIKRYTGFGTGPCQGKNCLTSVASQITALTGKRCPPFTCRPPLTPTSLGHFAALEDHDE